MDTSNKKSIATANQDLCSVVADNLKKLIILNNITQKELADQVGVTAGSCQVVTEIYQERKLRRGFIAPKDLRIR